MRSNNAVILDPSAQRSELLAVADQIRDGGDASALLRDRLPWFVRQIRADAKAGRFAEWGRSTVIDENVGAPVIPRPLFDELHSLAGLPERWPLGNAGVLHVYGYLLSTVPTPYGPKGNRWLNPQLSGALGLADDAFTPWSPSPSTLERVAAVATPMLHSVRDAPGMWFWAEESDSATVARTVVVRRDGAADGVLVYGVDEGRGMRLVTLFPITGLDEQWVAALLASAPRLRYNAVAGALPAGSPLADRRIMVQP